MSAQKGKGCNGDCVRLPYGYVYHDDGCKNPAVMKRRLKAAPTPPPPPRQEMRDG